MSECDPTNDRLVDDIRLGKTQAWSELIERYQGRLLNFAAARLPQRADAEDIVQEALIAFIKGLDSFRDAATLETYLFTILRNKICDRYRGRWSRSVCLIQDVYGGGHDGDDADVLERMPAPGPAASWYVHRSEQRQLQQGLLAEALRKLLKQFKKSLKFRNLKMVELLFYCRIPAAHAATLLELKDTTVRAFKYQCLKRLRENVGKADASPEIFSADFENILTETWESHRLSCPKRSTLRTFLSEAIEPGWFDYVDFHLTTVGCHFCRANLKDLRRQDTHDAQQFIRKRIMASTIGFLTGS